MNAPSPALQPMTHYSSSMASSGAERAPLILVVDDDKVSLLMLKKLLMQQGYQVLTADNGSDAMEIALRECLALDIILLDKMMPGMGGLEVVSALRSNEYTRDIPVVMQTGAGQPDDIRAGIDAGVFYYLVKPMDANLLHSVMEAALREARMRKSLHSALSQHRISFGLIDSCRMLVGSLGDAEGLASFLAHCFPNPRRVITGLAELLVNAVEHGNLGISYEEKTRLLKENQWREEILRRTELPEHQGKQVEVIFKRKQDGFYVQITDEGNGFDWRQYMEIDPARAGDNHGRGIAQANLLSFDRLQYLQSGNRVVAAILNQGRNEALLEW